MTTCEGVYMNQLHALADTLQDLSRWNAFRLRLFFEGIVVGIAGGFTIGSFIWALDESSEIRRHIFATYIEPALSNGAVHGSSLRYSWHILCIACVSMKPWPWAGAFLR